MEYSLRRATGGDREELLQLVKISLSDYGLTANPEETDKDLSDLDKFYFNVRGWFEVLEYEKKIIGSYGLFQLSDEVCELRKMYLLKEFQGRGLGKKLMQRALDKAIELGYKTMVLETNKKLDKAIGLYQVYGFTEYKPTHFSDRCDFGMKKDLT